MIADIALFLVAFPLALGLLVAAGFGLLIIGTAVYYLVCYGRLP